MNEADLTGIGKRIQNRRKQQGYTQEQLAEMMNVSIQMVSNLERGNKAIRIDNLINLSVLQDSVDSSAETLETDSEAESGEAQQEAESEWYPSTPKLPKHCYRSRARCLLNGKSASFKRSA